MQFSQKIDCFRQKDSQLGLLEFVQLYKQSHMRNFSFLPLTKTIRGFKSKATKVMASDAKKIYIHTCVYIYMMQWLNLTVLRFISLAGPRVGAI